MYTQRIPSDNDDTGSDLVGFTDEMDRNPTAWRFLKILQMLRDSKTPEETHTVLDYLETWSQADYSVQRYTPLLVKRDLAKLSIILECMMRLRTQLPQLRFGSIIDVHDISCVEMQEHVLSIKNFVDDDAFKCSKLVRFGNPFDKKFWYPADPTRTKAMV